MNKTVIIGSDHAGFQAKEEIKLMLQKLKFDYEDVGAFSEKSVDYPDIAKRVCEDVLSNSMSVGILICGSGTGMQISANKFKGIRAAFCYDVYSARMARKDNNANVLTLRSREFDHSLYEKIIVEFLNTDFSNEERHKTRLSKLED